MTTSPLEDLRIDPERSCRSCAHPKWMECGCFCCAADEEAEFAEVLEALALAALADDDKAAAGWFWTASGEHGKYRAELLELTEGAE
jgi:hypothetical protein